MNISREEKKAEAIRRMKMLQIHPEAIRQFEEDDTIMVSEPPFGGLYWLKDHEKEEVKEIEEKYHALVYMVVRAYTNIGQMDSFLLISDYQEEWEWEREDIPYGIVFTYTANRDVPDFSELGSISVKPVVGGLIRTF